MPGRQSHGPQASLTGRKRTAKRNKTKRSRAQNAFAIASQQVDDNARVPTHRLGESEETTSAKRGDHSDEDSELHQSKRTKLSKGNHDHPDASEVDSGSDSDGNRWLLGEVGSGDDSDIDSEAAFGESDEERFDGYNFIGSSTATDEGTHGHFTKAMRFTAGDVSGVDDLGDDAVDLATILDQEEADTASSALDASEATDEDISEQDSPSDDTDGSSVAGDLETDLPKLAELRRIAEELSRQDSHTTSPHHPRSGAGAGDRALQKAATVTKKELKLEDLALPVVTDPALRRSLKLLTKETGTRSGDQPASMKLAVPLAKRQQDQLDRDVAYDRSKETLSRWTDTVKHNRRADHLVFPLAATDVNRNNRLSKPDEAVPFSELEAAIERIVGDSGFDLNASRSRDSKINDYDDLPSNDITLEEAKVRREQLRRARDLIFREETKAKRIKKIKSKSYRRVHRRQREREEKQIEDESRAAGFEPSDDELEALDRRRATARMSDKHRSSKWARSIKATGQATWDQEARESINDVVRRDEELGRRLQERFVTGRNASDDGSAGDSDDSNDPEAAEQTSVQAKSLAKLNKIVTEAETKDLPSKLSSMKFMLRAESAKRMANEGSVAQLRRELEDDASMSDNTDDVVTDIGRRSFGIQAQPGSRNTSKDNEAGQHHMTDAAEADHALRGPIKYGRTSSSRPNGSAAMSRTPVAVPVSNPHEAGAWSRGRNGDSIQVDATGGHSTTPWKKSSHSRTVDIDDLDVSSATMLAAKAPRPELSETRMAYNHDSNNDEEETHEASAFQVDRELVRRAFAGADVVGEFAAEKSRVIADEEGQVVDETLPGWGSWTGHGVSKRERQRATARFVTTTEGIKAEDRKDSKLDRVVINEKRVKKNNRYLASSLPHPFETRQQYERSLRIPVGPEWTTKATFQDATKPRILLKQGIIAPMTNPLF